MRKGMLGLTIAAACIGLAALPNRGAAQTGTGGPVLPMLLKTDFEPVVAQF